MGTVVPGKGASDDRGDHAGGALFLTLVGVGWVMIGLSALGPIPLTLLAAPAAALVLLLGGVHALRRALPAPPPNPETDRAIAKATAWEAAAIVVIVVACSLLHRPTWIVPLVAVAVGVHFFPLARALNRPLYQITGAALCAVGAGVMLWMPASLGPRHLPGWLLGTGIGGGVVIWLTAVALLAAGFARACRPAA